MEGLVQHLGLAPSFQRWSNFDPPKKLGRDIPFDPPTTYTMSFLCVCGSPVINMICYSLFIFSPSSWRLSHCFKKPEHKTAYQVRPLKAASSWRAIPVLLLMVLTLPMFGPSKYSTLRPVILWFIQFNHPVLWARHCTVAEGCKMKGTRRPPLWS